MGSGATVEVTRPGQLLLAGPEGGGLGLAIADLAGPPEEKMYPYTRFYYYIHSNILLLVLSLKGMGEVLDIYDICKEFIFLFDFFVIKHQK